MISFAENIVPILSIIKEINPKTILDVGSGFGKYSLLTREALLSQRAERGEIIPVDDIVIDCIEPSKYFQDLKFHNYLYENHYHVGLENFVPSKNYDLVLMIDVVEHKEKEEMKNHIARLKNSCSKILISTPKQVIFYKEEYYGDHCQHHISQWTKEDFVGQDYSNERSWVFLI